MNEYIYIYIYISALPWPGQEWALPSARGSARPWKVGYLPSVEGWIIIVRRRLDNYPGREWALPQLARNSARPQLARESARQ